MKKKVLLSSILTIALCVCLIAGSTYALFTDEAPVSISVTAGKVDVDANITDDSLKAWSLNETKPTGLDQYFANGGDVDENNDVWVDTDGNLQIIRMTPGDKVEFTIDVTNSSDVAIQYKLGAVSALPEAETDAEGNALPQVDLFPALTITATITKADGTTDTVTLEGTTTEASTDWLGLIAPATTAGASIATITVNVEFPNGTPAHDNAFQGGVSDIAFTVTAVQSNGAAANGEFVQ